MRQVPSRCLLFALALLVLAVPSFAQVRISVSFGPPALPVYEQPICPGEGYMWTQAITKSCPQILIGLIEGACFLVERKTRAVVEKPM